jgi:hypothetical protein
MKCLWGLYPADFPVRFVVFRDWTSPLGDLETTKKWEVPPDAKALISPDGLVVIKGSEQRFHPWIGVRWVDQFTNPEVTGVP